MHEKQTLRDFQVSTLKTTLLIFQKKISSSNKQNPIHALKRTLSCLQEIDLATGTSSSIQSGSRKLLGKSNPVHALKVHDGLIYSASSSIEGTALKVIISMIVIYYRNFLCNIIIIFLPLYLTYFYLFYHCM